MELTKELLIMALQSNEFCAKGDTDEVILKKIQSTGNELKKLRVAAYLAGDIFNDLGLTKLSEEKQYHVVDKQIGNQQKIDNLNASLLAYPVTDGFAHPAEDLMAELLNHYGVRILMHAMDSVVHAEFLRLCARTGWRIPLAEQCELIEKTLKHHDVQIRDGALHCVGHWLKPDFAPILRRHSEPVTRLRSNIDELLVILDRLEREEDV